MVCNVNKILRKTNNTNRYKQRQLAASKIKTEKAGHYDLVLCLTKANARICIGHLFSGVAKEDEAMSEEPLLGKTGIKVMADVKKAVHQVRRFDDSERLKLVSMSVFGSTARVLFD